MKLLTETSKKSIQPRDILLPLKEHQLSMLAECINIENYAKKNNFPLCVLADEAGAGKTAVLISLILTEKQILKNTNNLIIVPQNILRQWCEEITKFAGNKLSVKLFINYADVQDIYKDKEVFKYYDIVLTTTTFISSIFSSIISLDIDLHRIIIDEIDTNTLLFNSKYTDITCNICWLVSASIDNLVKKELVLFEYKVEPKNLEWMTCKCHPDYIYKSLELTKPNINITRCHDLIDLIYNYLPNELVSKINALNYTIVNPYNNKFSTDINSCIYFYNLQLIDEIRKHHDFLLACNNNLRNTYNNTNRQYLKRDIEKTTTQIYSKTQQLKNITKALPPPSQYCPICINTNQITDSDKNSILIKFECCQTVTCISCMKLIYEKISKCPFCLNTLDEDSISMYKNDTDCKINNKPVITKIDKLIDILDNIKENTKMIIFSNFVSSFKSIEKILIKKDIKYRYFTSGNIKDINKDVDEYKNSDCQVVFLNAEFNIFGLNLEFTTDLVLLHKLKHSLRHQVIGRAQRLGRTSTLNIYELLYDCEFENYID